MQLESQLCLFLAFMLSFFSGQWADNIPYLAGSVCWSPLAQSAWHKGRPSYDSL